jgi:PhnB protein
MAMDGNGKPPMIPGVAPHLVCDGAAAAIDFYREAFGAEEVSRLAMQNGRLLHARVTINGDTVMLVDENPHWNVLGPKTRGGASVTLHIDVPDVDAAFARATAAGATAVMPPTDMFWGARYGMVEDPFGHRWSLATPTKVLSQAEIEEGARAMMSRGG